MDLVPLRETLEALDPVRDPDRWALHAYRLGLAQSESATEEANLRGALELLGKAGRILDRQRAPLEFGRILTAAAQCHRRLGDPSRAAEMFRDALDLLESRAPVPEQGAALTNLGLALSESRRTDDAFAFLDEAVSVLTPARSDEERRLLGAALLNRAQGHQRAGSVAAIGNAVRDYEKAITLLEPASVQRGMAQHGLGAALLERHSISHNESDLGAAQRALRDCLHILSRDAFPFQHAIAQHSSAVAHERRGTAEALRRAQVACEMAMTILDPRLHAAYWQTAAATLARVDGALAEVFPGLERADHFIAVVSPTSDEPETEHEDGRTLLRDRLASLVGLPDVRVQTDLDGMVEAAHRAGPDTLDRFLRLLVPVLMELPDALLTSACAALSRLGSAIVPAADRILDSVIHDVLHGPQRVRMRDLLEANGWQRP